MNIRRLRLPVLLALASVLALPASPHGAILPSPQSPPGPGGGSGGSGGTPNAPSGPSTPAPPRPTATGGAPAGQPPSTTGPGQQPGRTVPTGTGSGTVQVDLTDWRLWWTFHRDEFIDLKETLARGAGLATGDDAVLGTIGARTGAQLPDPKRLHEVVVPALLGLLVDERNPDVLTAAMIALAKIGRGPSAVDAPAIESAIRPFLADPVQEVSETAALALGLNATPSAAALLASIALDDERGRELVKQGETPYRTRAFACYGLGTLGLRVANPDVKRFVVHSLVTAFQTDRSATRDVKTASLVALGLVPLPHAKKGETGTEAPATSAEADLGWLLAVWNDKHESELVRAYAATTAARLAATAPSSATDAWEDALIETLKPGTSQPAVLQQSAAMALGLLGDNDDDARDARIRQALQRALEDGEALTRRFAAIALARIGAHEGKGERSAETFVATRRLLLDELETAPSNMRPWMALALGVGEALRIRAGHDPSPEVQSVLVKGLERFKSPSEGGAWSIAAGLAKAMDARDALVAWADANTETEAGPHAALAIGLLGWENGVLVLRKILQESRLKPFVLRDSAIALGLLGASETVPTLVQMLGESNSLTSQSAIASALSYVGDARAIDPLLKLLAKGERPDRVRAFAAAALGGLADRDRIPWNASIAFTVNYWVPPATLYEPVGGTGILDLL